MRAVVSVRGDDGVLEVDGCLHAHAHSFLPIIPACRGISFEGCCGLLFTTGSSIIIQKKGSTTNMQHTGMIFFLTYDSQVTKASDELCFIHHIRGNLHSSVLVHGLKEPHKLLFISSD